MDKIIDHSYAPEFFTGPGLKYRITDPYAKFRHEECVICHESLRTDKKENQPILLTHSGNCAETFHGICLMESMKHNPNRCPYCRTTIEQSPDFSTEVSEFGSYIPDEPNRDVWLNEAELADAQEHFDRICYAHTRLRIVEDQAFEAAEHLKVNTEGYQKMKILSEVNNLLRYTVLENLQSSTMSHGRKKFFENMKKRWESYELAYKYTAMTFLKAYAKVKTEEAKAERRVLLFVFNGQAWSE